MAERRRAVFFLGAGASAHADIPTVVPMTQMFVRYIQSEHPKYSKVLTAIMMRLKVAGKGEAPDIEAIMRALHRLIDHHNDELSVFLEATHGLPLQDLDALKNLLQSYIRNQVLRPKDVSYLAPMLDSIWGGPVEIFSVNYDPCIELLSRNLQRRLIDGFTPEWNPQSLTTTDTSAVCLYKLHGSVLWYQSDAGWPIKIPIGPSGSKLELYDGTTAEPIMLYPMHKQPIEAPLLDFTYILKQRLESTSYLIVIGYSFRDDYLSALFRDAFNANSELHLINIGPDAWRSHQTLISKSPSYQRVFLNRITDVPFPAEKILTQFTAEFNGFAAAVNQYHEDVRVAQTGRNIDTARNIEPLSKYGEAALSVGLIDWPLAELQLEIEKLWPICVRNLSRAIVIGNPELLTSAANHSLSCLQAIWSRLHINLDRSDRWSIRCQMKHQHLGGGTTINEFYNLYHAAAAVHKELLILHWKLHKSQANVKETVSELVSSHQGVLKFLETLGSFQGGSLDEFRSILRPQLLEHVAEFDKWYDKMRSTTNYDIPLYQSEIMDICGTVFPKAFNHFAALLGVVTSEPAVKKGKANKPKVVAS